MPAWLELVLTSLSSALIAALVVWLRLREKLAIHRAQRALERRAEWTAEMHRILVEHASTLSQLQRDPSDQLVQKTLKELTEGKFLPRLGEAQLYASTEALRAIHDALACLEDFDPKKEDETTKALIEAERRAAVLLANDFREHLGEERIPPELEIVTKAHKVADG